MPYLGNEVAPLVQALEGKELKLDSDGDSSITADTDDRVDVKVGGSDIAHVTSTGLGVGTTSPSHELHITGSSDTRAIITSGGSGDAVMMFENASGNTWGHGLDLSSGNYAIAYNASGDPSLTSDGVFNIDANGHVTKTKQPAFLANLSTAQANVATGSGQTFQFDTEIFDQNADFNPSTYTFTAPVTGRYQFNFLTRYNSLDSGASYYQAYVVTSNRSYIHTIDPNYTADLNYYSLGFSFLADMDANDTAYVLYNQSGGTQQTNISAGGDTYFSGYLVA